MYNPDEECNKLVIKIKKICALKGLSYYSLAKKSHISTSTMHAIIKGKTRPQIYTLLQICNVLEVSIYELFDEDFLGELSEEEKEILFNFQCLTEKKKVLLKIYMDMLKCYNERNNKFI